MNTDRLKERFYDAIGPQVSDDPIDLKICSGDASSIKGKALLVLWPKDVDDVGRILRLSNLRSYPLTIRGAGCGVSGACVPKDCIVMDLSHMNHIISLDRVDNTVIVEPGVNVHDLNMILSKVNLWFPIVPFDAAVCTIGGMAATDCNGQYSHMYGKMSNWISKVEFMDGSGKQLKSEKLTNVVGREGATGIITAITLRLTQPLTTISMSHQKFEGADEMLTFLTSLSDEKEILAMHYLDKMSSQLLNWDNRHHMIILYNNESGQVKNREEIDRMWHLINAIPLLWKNHHHTHDADPKIAVEHLGDFLQFTRKASIPTTGDLGKGILHCMIKNDEEQLNTFYSMVRKLNGSISDGFGIGQLKKGYASSAYMDFVATLKRQYDPNQILNRSNL